jgi:hypothetical protein
MIIVMYKISKEEGKYVRLNGIVEVYELYILV